MKILFRKIDSMKYYQGVTLEDIPRRNGMLMKVEPVFIDEKPVKLPAHPTLAEKKAASVVKIDENATQQKLSEAMLNKYYYEDYIYKQVSIDGMPEKVCAIPLRGTGLGGSASYKVAEDICKKDGSFEDTLIIWVAARDKGAYRIVGWHNKCVVCGRNFEVDYDGTKRHCRAYCYAEDAVMLPYQIRGLLDWEVPFIQTHGYGFGPSMTFDMDDEHTRDYVEKLLKIIASWGA